MKYWYKRIQAVMLMICMLLTVGTVHKESVYAASGNVSIAVSSSQLKVGDSVTVTITVSSDAPIGAYSLSVSYNAAVLEYTGGDGSGGGGTVNIAAYGDGTSTRASSSLNFRAIANGSSSIITGGNDAYAYDESPLSMSHGSTSITVAAPSTQAPSQPNPGDDNTDNSNPATTALEDKDTTLKSLEISPGTLTPAFSSSVTSYSVELPEDTTSIMVSAAANDPTASVTVSHNNDLEPGMNKTYIVVTATNGLQRTYVLNITCGEVKEEEIPEIQIDGTTYTPAAESDMAGVAIPDGFTSIDIEYQDVTITGYETENQALQIVYLLDEEGRGVWFIYDKEQALFYPYIELPVVSNRYVILNLPQDLVLPDGYKPIEWMINDQTVLVYVKNPDDELVLVYATNLQKEAGFYLYDKVEGTFQRYIEPEIAVTTEEVTEAVTENTTEALTEGIENEKFTRVRTLLYIVCGIVIVLLIVLVVMITTVKKQMTTDMEEALDQDKQEEAVLAEKTPNKENTVEQDTAGNDRNYEDEDV